MIASEISVGSALLIQDCVTWRSGHTTVAGVRDLLRALSDVCPIGVADPGKQACRVHLASSIVLSGIQSFRHLQGVLSALSAASLVTYVFHISSVRDSSGRMVSMDILRPSNSPIFRHSSLDVSELV